MNSANTITTTTPAPACAVEALAAMHGMDEGLADAILTVINRRAGLLTSALLVEVAVYVEGVLPPHRRAESGPITEDAAALLGFDLDPRVPVYSA